MSNGLPPELQKIFSELTKEPKPPDIIELPLKLTIDEALQILQLLKIIRNEENKT